MTSVKKNIIYEIRYINFRFRILFDHSNSLPSPLEFDASPPESARERVTDVVCGKEHCLMLTESGRVYSWGGGSRGQLGHGTLSSESSPRLITALDGLRITKIAGI